MKVSVRLDSTISAHLREMTNAVTREIQVAALKKGAEPIRRAAAALAPEDEHATPPHLNQNIIIAVPTETQLAETGNEEAHVLIGPRKEFFYGFFREFGYGGGAATPFLRPAFDSEGQRALAIVGSELWAGIRRGLESQSGRGRSSGVGL